MPDSATVDNPQQQLVIRELPAQALLEVCCADAAAMARALSSRFALPDRLMTATVAAGGTALWLAPDRFLFCLDGGPYDRFEAEWAAIVQGAVAVDVSWNWRRFAIEGPRARDLLAKGLAIDLRPAYFGAGECRQTLLSRVPVVIHATAIDAFCLFAATSYADWLGDWLRDAALEFGGC